MRAVSSLSNSQRRIPKMWNYSFRDCWITLITAKVYKQTFGLCIFSGQHSLYTSDKYWKHFVFLRECSEFFQHFKPWPFVKNKSKHTLKTGTRISSSTTWNTWAQLRGKKGSFSHKTIWFVVVRKAQVLPITLKVQHFAKYILFLVKVLYKTTKNDTSVFYRAYVPDYFLVCSKK